MAEDVSSAVQYFYRANRPLSGSEQVAGLRLVGHIPQSETTIHGRAAIVFGLPFLAIGIFIALMAAGLISPGRRSDHFPGWVTGSFGAIFGIPGLWLILHGLFGIARSRRLLSVQNREASWRSDYRWKESGIADQQGRGVVQMLLVTGFVVLFAAPFNFIAYMGVKEGSRLGYFFTCADFFVAIFAVILAYRVVRWLKFGTGRLRFLKFPYHPGEHIQVMYVPAHSLDGIEKLECTLRCIREAYETRGTGSDRRQEVACYELHKQTVALGPAQLCTSFDRSIELHFDLPAEGPSTCLASRPPTYWELEISGKDRGVDLNSRFLVPVYDRPGRN